MTAIKAFQQREADQIRSPLMKTLYYDQFMYYVVIVFIRIFNLAIWLAFPPSLFFLGLYFIWALIIAMVSRILLHLRSVACANDLADDSSFFGPTVRSTHIVWAQRDTTVVESSIHTMSTSDVREIPVAEGRSDTFWGGDEEVGTSMELQQMRSRKSGMPD
ncbi:glycoside hydrolase family 11 protein [Tulasnella calospora MUT 4182]|uniref:Glycoside hydrolase family 11 protein n=1 Tax=Tulasnella calospora MUT 4182 TaxID=1051891 RepID=A0A0C3PPT7_9AGAM|nr:glycoside hydrolase family 11 protein [Tulasnella calospora MUT 4182]